MTAKEYNKYTADYDKAGVIPNEIVVDELWDKCYCSSLPRAVTTAKTIYHGEIIPTDNLKEVPTAAIFNFKFYLPYNFWAVLGRFAWIRSFSSNPEGHAKTLKRINEEMKIIMEDKAENILIVSHAGTMYEIQKILRKKGFKGKRFFKSRNGKLYVFTKKR